MARENTATLDGVIVGYGTRNSANPEAGQVHTKGRSHEVEVNLDFRAMPTGQTVAASIKDHRIPAGSVIRSARLAVAEVFAGATTLSAGLRQLDGTAVGAATTILSAATVAAVGNVLADDLDVEASTTDVYLAVVTDVPATAGRGTLTVVYDEKVPASVEPAPVQGIVGTL
jgi:hypothetical protein